MSYVFKKALVRKPSINIEEALSSKNLKPRYHKVYNEHKKYIKSLILAGINIYVLPSMNDFPDSIFIEDPGLVYNKIVFC
jgi:dimethylargininase